MKAKFDIGDWVEVKGEPGAKYQIRDIQPPSQNNAGSGLLYLCHAQFPENHPEWPSMADRIVGIPESALKKVR